MYHEHPHPPKPRQRTVENITTPATMYVANGSIAVFSFPCFYQIVHPPIKAHQHCKDWHDHRGEPTPNDPDHSCQPYYEFAAWWTEMHKMDYHYPDFHGSPHRWCHAIKPLIDMKSLVPIHLLKEGYEKVYVAVKDAPEGLLVDGWIDEARDHVIKCAFNAAIEECETEPHDYRFSIVVEGHCKDPHVEKERLMRDVAVRGILHVDPGILSEYEEV